MSMFNRIFRYVSEELVYFVKCSPYRFKLDYLRNRSKVLVNGPAKTGTTWMYTMLKSLPGYKFIGNFKFDIEQYAIVQPGDIVHGHDIYSLEINRILQERGIKLVLMQRDPRDQIVSHMYHIRRITSHAWHNKLKDMPIDDALMLCIEGRMGEGSDFLGGAEFWVKFMRGWINNYPGLLVVRYEDLLSDTPSELLRVFSYIGFPAKEDFGRIIADKHRFGRLAKGKRIWKSERKQGDEDIQSRFRKGISGDWKNHFKNSHKGRFKELAGEDLIAFGYEKDLSW